MQHNKAFQFTFLVIILICNNIRSQTEIEQALQVKIEELQEYYPNETDLSDLTNKIAELKDHPIDINKSTENELRQIPFLSEKQIGNLIIYKETYGELLSIHELQAIEGFDSATIQNILPFLAISASENRKTVRIRELFSKGHVQFLARCQQVLQKQAGYSPADSMLKINPNAGYQGSPQKYYFRFKYDYFGRITVGIVGEKDPGEGFFTGSQQRGMDFYSGYVALFNTGMLEKLVLGNFNADFGQGLTMCSRLSFGALPSSGNLRRSATGISPSLSTNENSYLSGMAATIKTWKISTSLFFSGHKRDAKIISVDSVTGDPTYVSSLPESGYHRLPDEVAGMDAVTEIIYGGNVNFRNNFFTLGLTGFHSRWNAVCLPGDQLYDRYRFSGRSNLNAGMDFQFIFRSFYGFGEFSRSLNGGFAWLAGIQANPDPDIKLSLIWRDYRRDYQDLLSNAIGQNGNNDNEKGLILNLAARINSKLGFYAYVDIHKFPWLKYRTDFISYGSEFSGQCDYSPSKSVLMLLRYRVRKGQLNETDGRPMRSWVNRKTESLRYQAVWKLNATLDLCNRFEMVRTSGEGEKTEYGYFISQDLSYKPRQIPAALSFRYALFNTGSYATRIYAYEQDVLYGYSVPALEGSGIRCFLLLSSRPWRFIEVWARYSLTYYSDRQEIGTGLEKTEGNRRSEIKIQVLFRI